MKTVYSLLLNLLLVAALTFGLVSSGPAAAAPLAIDLTPLNIKLLNQFGGLVTCVAVSGNYAYVGEGPRLVIYDIGTTPGLLQEIERTGPMLGTVAGITFVNGAAYVADNEGGLYIFDVSDVHNPIQTYHYLTPGPAKKIGLKGDYLYLADGTAGLLIFNGLTSGVPVYQTSISLENALDVVIQGNYAYVADFSDGIAVVNITNPLAPSLVHTFDTPGSARGVATDGVSLFVADFTAGLEIYDLTVPGTLSLQGQYPGSASHQAVQVRLKDPYAYVADGDQGMEVINIHSKNAPALKGSLSILGWFTSGIDVSGNYAYLAVDDFGFRIVDITNPASPLMTGMGAAVPDIGYAMRMSVLGTRAYVVNENRSGVLGFEIVDLSSPGHSNSRGIYYSVGHTNGVAPFKYNGLTYVYLANSTSLEIANVDDIDNPTQVNNILGPAGANYANISVMMPTLTMATPSGYLCDVNHALVWMLNLANPANPVFQGSIILGSGTPQAVQPYGAYVYVAGGTGGLRILYFSELLSYEAGHLDLPGYAGNLDVLGTRVYVSSGAGGLHIVDVSSVSNPVEVGAYTDEFVEDVQVRGNLAFLSTLNGVRILDVSDPAHLKVMGFYPALGSNYNIALGNNPSGAYFYTTGVNNGFYEFQMMFDIYLPVTMK